MKREYITIKSEKELYKKELELKESGYKRTFNSLSSQVWEQGVRQTHKTIVLELEY